MEVGICLHRLLVELRGGIDIPLLMFVTGLIKRLPVSSAFKGAGDGWVLLVQTLLSTPVL